MSRKTRTRAIGFLFVAVFAVFGLSASKPPKESSLVWEPWSPEAIEAALENDRPVFVDFTATWCVTCQVNKKAGYTKPVEELIEKYDILLLKADNTRREPEINAAIRELGRAAVPVNVLYVPGDDEPHLTTELFTGGYLVDFFNERLGADNS